MKYYCIGIKGSGMATLACLLHDLGHIVYGYDDTKEWKFTQEGLDKRGIVIFNDASFSPDSDTVFTCSKAFREDHSEIQRMEQLGVEKKAYNEILGELTDQFETISVAGTHGKTTTSSLISHILNSIYGCNYFIGDGTGYANQKNAYFVIESDEFNRHFLAYHPTYSIITNIELEHTECYSDIEDIINTFEQFAHHTKKGLIVCGDNENIRKISFDKDVLFYGFEEQNDVIAQNVELTKDGSSFDVYIKDEFYDHFEIPLFGKHMVLNALACITLCDQLGVSKEEIHKALLTFQNAKRRFAEEVIDDIVIIDDYAHHPTEIKVTLEAAKQKYPEKELVVLFKPNTYSRTAAFPKEFAEALNIADYAYLTEIDCNRESASDYPFISSKIILDQLNNGRMIDETTVDQLLKHKNAVVCMMSCASIEHLKEAYRELLNQK